MPARYALQTPHGVPGAIGLIRLASDTPDELDGVFGSLGVAPVPVSSARLREIRGEEVIVARWSSVEAHIMPHSGVETIRHVTKHLSELALPGDSLARDPKAAINDALARAASPLAIDILLDQPRRMGGARATLVTPEHAVSLQRLIYPPLIVVWGPPNVGKSTLLNRLARSEVSIVAPEPGTTRDHVGVLLDLAGLVVRYADTPGIRPDAEPAEADAIEISRALFAAADLVLWCRDRFSERPALPHTTAIVLPLDLRADLGLPSEPAPLAVSSHEEGSLRSLVHALREALVPEAALRDPGLWALWSR